MRGILVNALPERLRLTYFPAEFIAFAMSFIIGSLAFMVTFIGLSRLLAGWLSRYAFNASALLRLLPPPVPPEQSAAEKTIAAIIIATIPNTLLEFFRVFFIENSFLAAAVVGFAPPVF